MSKVLEVKDLKKHYIVRKSEVVDGKRVSKQTIKAVDGVSFDVKEGETIGIIGESGCGKTTLGRVLVNLEPITSGSVKYYDKPIGDLLKADRLKFHKMVQMVFQNPYDTFDFRLTIDKIMLEPLKLHGIGKDEKERRSIIIKALENGGLKPATDYLKRYPHELSGGQLQRISIIRAMLLKPKFLIADEPVSMLDVSIRGEIIKMLQELTSKEKTTLIFISHDIATTRFISDKIIVMYFGKIVEMGQTQSVLSNPQHDYTKLLINSVASIDPREGKRRARMNV